MCLKTSCGPRKKIMRWGKSIIQWWRWVRCRPEKMAIIWSAHGQSDKKQRHSDTNDEVAVGNNYWTNPENGNQVELTDEWNTLRTGWYVISNQQYEYGQG